MKPIFYRYVPSPVGELLLLANAQGLLYLAFEFEQRRHSVADYLAEESACHAVRDIFRQADALLERYFSGEEIDFSALDFLQLQGTPFQLAVWRILSQIPYGQSLTYGDIAEKLGKPKAVRAVGGAVGRNPISIFVPCHRVLGKDQTLTGFGGGLAAKRALLQLEKIAYRDQGTEWVRVKTKTFK